jgi:hypothetical protein
MCIAAVFRWHIHLQRMRECEVCMFTGNDRVHEHIDSWRTEYPNARKHFKAFIRRSSISFVPDSFEHIIHSFWNQTFIRMCLQSRGRFDWAPTTRAIPQSRVHTNVTKRRTCVSQQDSCVTNGRTCNILSNKSAIRQLSVFRRNIKGYYANMLRQVWTRLRTFSRAHKIKLLFFMISF